MSGLLALVPKFKFDTGPTFVIGCEVAELQWLEKRFLELSESKQKTSFVIGDCPPIESDGMCKLVVTAGDANKVHRTSDSEFSWAVARESAIEIAEKISAMLTSSAPSHQYLDNGVGRYQTIVVTKGEYPNESLRAMRDQI